MADDPATLPVYGSGQGEEEMPASDQFNALHEQNMSGMGQAMTRFQSDATTISKAADYDFLQSKNLVSLSQAVGVREVASRVTPAGPVPATGVSPSPGAGGTIQ